MTTKTGTIDNPTATQLDAEYYIDSSGPGGGIPTLSIAIKVGSILAGDRPGWTFDSVIDIDPDDGEITLLYFPSGDDEGWARLDDVGEW